MCPQLLPVLDNSVARILMNESLISSRTAIACDWAIRLSVRTSTRKSLAFFCNPRKWLYTSGANIKSARYWLMAIPSGFGGGAGFSVRSVTGKIEIG